jgi:hypothetical protein
MGLSLRSGRYGNYWGNDYNTSNSLNMEQMKVNATYIAQSLLASGWSLNAIAGMLGNMQTESSINPGRWQSDRVGGDASGHGYGLVQWTPYTKYTDWVTGDPSTMDNNLLRINYEVNNGLQWIPTQRYPQTFSEFKTSTLDAYTLGLMFLANYERPADPDQPSRGTQAEFWYDYLGGITPVRHTKNKKFKWVLYARKLRNKNLNINT